MEGRQSDWGLAARGLLSGLLNAHHAEGAKPDIAMFASRRSGTTVLAEVFARSPGIRAVDQPDSIYTAGARHASFLPPYAGGFPYDLSERDRELLRTLYTGLRRGEFSFRQQWRPWAKDFHFRSDRLFLKLTDSHGIASDLLSFLPLRAFAFFRHPVPHALSCLRLGWGPREGGFLRHSGVLELFSADQRRFISQVDRNGDMFARLVVNWFVENSPLLRDVYGPSSLVPGYTYESLVTNPVRTLSCLSAHLELPIDEKMISALDSPSRSSRPRKSGSTVSETLSLGQPSALVEGWLSQLAPNQASASNDIFAALGCSLYSANSPYPLLPEEGNDLPSG